MVYMSYRVPRYVALLNLFFDRCYPIYRSVYFIYKRIADRRICSFLRKRLCEIGPKATILDIGANVGFYTRFFNENANGTASILAFEPAPANVKRLVNETSSFANVKIFPCAVSDGSQVQLELALSPDSSIDHHLSCKKGEESQSFLVKAVALDEACEDLPSVDIIKMDIQGAEYLALKGMTKLLARSPACVIVMEIWPWGLRRAGSDWQELMELLKKSKLVARSFDGGDVEEWCRINADRSDAYLNAIVQRCDNG
jgi:FkbM family methyltransferase